MTIWPIFYDQSDFYFVGVFVFSGRFGRMIINSILFVLGKFLPSYKNARKNILVFLFRVLWKRSFLLFGSVHNNIAYQNVLSLVLYYLQRLYITTQSFVDVVQRIYFKFPELSCQQEPGHGLELQKIPNAIRFLIQDVDGIDRGKSEK